MARTKKPFSPPDWFQLSNYSDAAGMDGADWYVNLLLRGHVHREPKDKLSRFLRKRPVPRRGEESGLMLAMSVLNRTDVDPDVLRILNGREPRPSVNALRTDELYFFEKMLPAPIREFGATFEPARSQSSGAPKNFTDSLDSVFPTPMLGVFARINLGKSDDEIVADLRDFIREKREGFAKLNFKQPHREAMQVFGKHNAPNFKTFAKRAVLPYMDIKAWLDETNTSITGSALADLLELDADTLKETKKNAVELLDNLVMSGWLTAQARAAIRKSKKQITGETFLGKSP